MSPIIIHNTTIGWVNVHSRVEHESIVDLFHVKYNQKGLVQIVWIKSILIQITD